ncbi:MAG TPA: permease prefix domain 1-containing protein, partial [Bryobacteraceae bacterium]
MRRFLARVAALVGRGRAEREMEREIAAHLGLIEEDYLRRGLSPAAARLAARRAYGGVEQAREVHRDARSFVSIEQLVQDIRHAWRSLTKSP